MRPILDRPSRTRERQRAVVGIVETENHVSNLTRALLGFVLPFLLEAATLTVLGAIRPVQPAIDLAPLALILSVATSGIGFYWLTQRHSLMTKALIALGYFPLMLIVDYYLAIALGGAI